MTRPSCCHACQSRTIKPHCGNAGCPWITCKKCLAVTGRFLGKPWSRGGTGRAGNRPADSSPA